MIWYKKVLNRYTRTCPLMKKLHQLLFRISSIAACPISKCEKIFPMILRNILIVVLESTYVQQNEIQWVKLPDIIA